MLIFQERKSFDISIASFVVNNFLKQTLLVESVLSFTIEIFIPRK